MTEKIWWASLNEGAIDAGHAKGRQAVLVGAKKIRITRVLGPPL